MTQYTRLPSEEPEVPAYDADDRTAGSSRINTDNANNDDKTENENQFVALPPPYGDNSDLPTYEEVERIKRDEEDRDSENPYSALLNGSMTANLFSSEMEVGSDSIFLLTFLS
ncbi:uncharacterized protein LOC134853507 [Symsagittifera roscoffensis]|uniref:uncharacterized protein LOC134853507 n=1 Tax=Symsagittifera roscoffensis TaxID=84072 RepID=UPI00307BDDEA